MEIGAKILDVYVSFHTAKRLHELGFSLYTNYQYDENKNKTHYTLEQCAVYDVLGKPVLYIPTCEQAYTWIRQTYPGWEINITYTNGWHFIVKNIDGYIYKEPQIPDMDYNTAFDWGILHVLNRVGDDVKNDEDFE